MLRSWYPTGCVASLETEAEKHREIDNMFTILFEFHMGHNTTCLHPGKMCKQYVAAVTSDIVSYCLDVTLVISAVMLTITKRIYTTLRFLKMHCLDSSFQYRDVLYA